MHPWQSASVRTTLNTFIVLDATELRTKVPSSLDLQSQLHSSVKSHTTLKGLVGTSPNSLSFVSE